MATQDDRPELLIKLQERKARHKQRHILERVAIVIAGNAAWEILRGVLAMAPLTKICYGSDGFKVPEIMYTSARLSKQAVASVLAELVNDGMLTQCDAEAAARLILSGNARELYRLD